MRRDSVRGSVRVPSKTAAQAAAQGPARRPDPHFGSGKQFPNQPFVPPLRTATGPSAIRGHAPSPLWMRVAVRHPWSGASTWSKKRRLAPPGGLHDLRDLEPIGSAPQPAWPVRDGDVRASIEGPGSVSRKTLAAGPSPTADRPRSSSICSAGGTTSTGINLKWDLLLLNTPREGRPEREHSFSGVVLQSALVSDFRRAAHAAVAGYGVNPQPLGRDPAGLVATDRPAAGRLRRRYR